MLVVSRKVGQAMMIGDDVEVDVRALRPEAVELRVVRRECRGRLTTETTHRLIRGDEIDLDDACSCALLDLCGDRVRLGFDVPKSASVHRKEVYDAIRRETRGDS